jgi:hypothetical protein
MGPAASVGGGGGGSATRVGTPTNAAYSGTGSFTGALPTGSVTGTLVCIYVVNNSGTTPALSFTGDSASIPQTGVANTWTNEGAGYKSYLYSAVIPNSTDAANTITAANVASNFPMIIMAFSGATSCVQAGFAESATGATSTPSLSVTATGASKGQAAFVVQRANTVVPVTVTQPADFTHWGQGSNLVPNNTVFILEEASSLSGYVNGNHQWSGFVSDVGVVSVQQVELR